MRSNLTTQGYCLSDAERRELALGLRFSTGLCLTLVVVALALQSPVMVFALSGIGLVAGFGARHPFDHVWNHGVRHSSAARAAAQPDPAAPRVQGRDGLAAVGRDAAQPRATTVALVLGGLLVAVCGVVTATQSLPAIRALAGAWWRWRGTSTATT